MKIFIDIGHPGHVHYFKNLIKNLEQDKHEVIVTARKRDVVFSLLEAYRISFKNRGTGRNSRLGKLLYMLRADIQLLFLSLRFRPDLYLSFSSPYAAQVSWLMRKPHIALNDTEHQVRHHSIFTFPFTSKIITPYNFQLDLGEKHVRLRSIFEGFYLHPKYFVPDKKIKSLLNLKEDQEYVILRFISWQAHHDYGQSGLSLDAKRDLIELLSERYTVFISAEEDLPDEFKSYQINIAPEKMHDVLAAALLFVGESGTMASESAYLGTQSVFINSLPSMCPQKLEEEHGILKHFTSSDGVVQYVKGFLQQKDLKKQTILKSNMMKKSFIEPTAFLTEIIVKNIV